MDMITLMAATALELQEEEGARPVSDKEMINNLTTLILAGHDTTATALTVAMYYMAINPDVQAKARAEVDEVLGQDPYPSLQQQKNLPYLMSVVREVQRLYPSAANLTERVTSRDIVTPNGVLIPKDTCVMVNIWAMQRDPELWGPDADQFNPERFMDPVNAKRITTVDYMAFNHGPRVCMGMQFALNELRVVLCMVLKNYEWRLPKDSRHASEIQVAYPWLLDIRGMEMEVQARTYA